MVTITKEISKEEAILAYKKLQAAIESMQKRILQLEQERDLIKTQLSEQDIELAIKNNSLTIK